jgi:hypothetical protein
MGVNDRSDANNRLEKSTVGRRIRGGAEGAFNDFSIEIHHDDVVDLQKS